MLIHDNPFEHLGYIPNKLYSVKITTSSLRKRSEPSINGMEIGLITDQGIYDIFDVSSGWGRLKDGSWIMLRYTMKLNEEINKNG